MLNRNRALVVLTSAIFLTLGACQTEVDDKPAAEIGEAVTSQEPQADLVSADIIGERSRIDWVAAKVTRQHDGGFHSFDGSILFAGDEPKKISFAIDMSSIWSDTEKLTKHLRTEDFFDVETYPTARFESTSIARNDSAGEAQYEITGNLEMRGKTNSITFPAIVDMNGETIDASAEFTIDRQKWDVSYKGAPDNLIRDDVLVKLDLTFPKPSIRARATEADAPTPAESESRI